MACTGACIPAMDVTFIKMEDAKGLRQDARSTDYAALLGNIGFEGQNRCVME
jgi:hypothetical protein